MHLNAQSTTFALHRDLRRGVMSRNGDVRWEQTCGENTRENTLGRLRDLCSHFNYTEEVSRIMLRRKGQQAVRESFHRDQSPIQADEVVFGGWLNLDDDDQYFSACPGTYNQRVAAGFHKITDKAQLAGYRKKVRKIRIPPGFAVLFYQNIVHEVVGTKATYSLSVTVYHGTTCSHVAAGAPHRRSATNFKKRVQTDVSGNFW